MKGGALRLLFKGRIHFSKWNSWKAWAKMQGISKVWHGIRLWCNLRGCQGWWVVAVVCPLVAHHMIFGFSEWGWVGWSSFQLGPANLIGLFGFKTGPFQKGKEAHRHWATRWCRAGHIAASLHHPASGTICLWVMAVKIYYVPSLSSWNGIWRSSAGLSYPDYWHWIYSIYKHTHTHSGILCSTITGSVS